MTTPPSVAARTFRTFPALAAALLSLAGVAAVWLPFAWSTSPAEALLDRELWYAAVPFLLTIPIAVACAWIVARGSLPSGVGWVARALAGCAMLATALLYARALGEADLPGRPTDWIGFFAPAPIAAAWIVLMVRWRPGPRPVDAEEAVALMEAAFLPNAVLCLISFSDNRETGWYVTLAVAAAFAAHVVATARRAVRVGTAEQA